MPVPASQSSSSDLEAGIWWVQEHHVPSRAGQGVMAGCPSITVLAAGSPTDGLVGGEQVRGCSRGLRATKDSEGHGPWVGGTAWGQGLLTAVPPLTETCCPWGNIAPKGRSRALWRHLLAPKGTLTPALIHSCPSTPCSCTRQKSMSSDIPLQQQIGRLRQRKGLAQGHRAGDICVV